MLVKIAEVETRRDHDVSWAYTELIQSTRGWIMSDECSSDEEARLIWLTAEDLQPLCALHWTRSPAPFFSTPTASF